MIENMLIEFDNSAGFPVTPNLTPPTPVIPIPPIIEPSIPTIPLPEITPPVLPPQTMQKSLAMAYVPNQNFTDLYETDLGFSRGTIYKELDLPFIGQEAVIR